MIEDYRPALVDYIPLGPGERREYAVEQIEQAEDHEVWAVCGQRFDRDNLPVEAGRVQLGLAGDETGAAEIEVGWQDRDREFVRLRAREGVDRHTYTVEAQKMHGEDVFALVDRTFTHDGRPVGEPAQWGYSNDRAFTERMAASQRLQEFDRVVQANVAEREEAKVRRAKIWDRPDLHSHVVTHNRGL